MAYDMDEVKNRRNEYKKRGFEDWLSQSTTRFMMSLIPAGDHKDALLTLLRNSYESGFEAGGASFAADMISEFMRVKKKG